MESNLERFRVSEKALFIKNNKCLLLRTVRMPDIWELPGGRIDMGENSKEALRREVKEEVGIDEFRIIQIIDFQTWLKPPCSKIPTAMIVYLVDGDSSDIKISKDHLEYAWFSEKELESIKFYWPTERESIKKGFYSKKLIKN